MHDAKAALVQVAMTSHRAALAKSDANTPYLTRIEGFGGPASGWPFNS
jgi:hypothetical protein